MPGLNLSEGDAVFSEVSDQWSWFCYDNGEWWFMAICVTNPSQGDSIFSGSAIVILVRPLDLSLVIIGTRQMGPNDCGAGFESRKKLCSGWLLDILQMDEHLAITEVSEEGALWGCQLQQRWWWQCKSSFCETMNPKLMILYTLQVSVEERRERIDSVLDEILSVPRWVHDILWKKLKIL